MTVGMINIKEELVSGIKNKMSDITYGCKGIPVYLKDVSFRASASKVRNDKISIICLFINEEGKVCADMFRSGPAGCVDFICGIIIESFEESILVNIITCLNKNMWYISDSPDVLRKNKKTIVSAFKIPFFKKGA